MKNNNQSTSSTLFVGNRNLNDNDNKGYAANNPNTPSCLFCGKTRQVVVQLQILTHEKIIQEKRRCFICLRNGHRSRSF